jgi:Uma2 family endonuclease
MNYSPSTARDDAPKRRSQRLLLSNVSWSKYEALLAAFDDRHLRLTYDRGTLEIMPLSPEHEREKVLARRLVETLTEELEIESGGFGSVTCRKENAERGLEPDESYYIANYRLVKGKKRLNLKRDPPPDLVIEIDITHSSLDRMEIYAALRIGEVWRVKGEILGIYALDADQHYHEVEHSPTFPMVSVEELNRFLAIGRAEDDNAMLRAFRAWIRERIKKSTRRKHSRG